MSRHLLTEPKTDAQLFDMLHGLFGIGDFDDSKDVPWFKWRMTEIAIIKRVRAKRQITLGDMATAARFCYRRRIPIRQSYQLCEHIVDAKRDARARKITDLSQGIAEAIINERSRPDTDREWVDRLLRARGEFRRQVLEEWSEQRWVR